MVSYTAKAGAYVRRKGPMLLGKVPHKLMNRKLTTGDYDLAAQYASRALMNAKARQGRRANERPDDKKPIQPDQAKNAEPEAEEGSNEGQLSGARLEEMLKLAGGNEVAS